MTQRTIVGIDPGTTAAVAVLGLDGELIAHHSQKQFSKDRMISVIISHGKPVIVATDVTPAPSRVATIAANLGAELVVPDHDLGADEKDASVDRFTIAADDDHTRDAVAAAVHAYEQYRDQLDRIRDRVTAQDADDAYGAVVDRVLGGTPISDAITAVTATEQDETAASEPADTGMSRDWERIAEQRQDRIEQLETTISNLEEYIEQLEADREDDDAGVDEAVLRERNRLIRELEQRVDHQEARIEQLLDENTAFSDAVARLLEDWTYVPAVTDPATADADVIFVPELDSPDISETVDVVITESVSCGEEQVAAAVWLLDDIDGAVRFPDGIVIPPNALETQAEEPATDRFMQWLDDYRNR